MPASSRSLTEIRCLLLRFLLLRETAADRTLRGQTCRFEAYPTSDLSYRHQTCCQGALSSLGSENIALLLTSMSLSRFSAGRSVHTHLRQVQDRLLRGNSCVRSHRTKHQKEVRIYL